MSVDENNNLYIAEVNSGRAQKFIPRQDARMEFITAKPLIE
jgi:hypothetical protein